jgi:hypothetical protein
VFSRDAAGRRGKGSAETLVEPADLAQGRSEGSPPPPAAVDL